MFEILFTPPSGVTTDLQFLKVRVSGFTPPTPTQAKYTVHYKSVSIPKPSTKIEFDRSFTVKVRVDADYKVLTAAREWQKLSMDPSTGYATQGPTSYGSVKVKALSQVVGSTTASWDGESSSTTATKTWTYSNVWIESISAPTYSYESSEPATVDVKFNFGEYVEA
jgi:hypothetical protein